MDPNANLSEQSYLLGYGADIDRVGRLRLIELRRALSDWLANGGFKPDWTAYPDAANAFHTWRTGKTSNYARTKPRVSVVCLECGKRWKVSPNASTLQCSKCNSVDIDVVT